MGVTFVILGAISFGVGYALLELEDVSSGIALFLLSSVLLAASIIIDGINKVYRQMK